MDGRNLTSELKKIGLKTISVSSTKVRGFRSYSSGDFYCKREKSFGCWTKNDTFLKIYFNSEKDGLKDIILKALSDLGEAVLFQSNNEIIIN